MDAQHSVELFISSLRLVHLSDLRLEHHQCPGFLFRIRRFHLVSGRSPSHRRAIGCHGCEICRYIPNEE